MRTQEPDLDVFLPWNDLLGVRSQVRALRVLERDREAMTVRELGRRAKVGLRSVQVAVERLRKAGIVRRVGTGPRGLIEWNVEHPLSADLAALFQAERDRKRRIINAVTEVVGGLAPIPISAWLKVANAETVELELGVLADAAKLDALVDELREGLGPLMRREALWIEVRGWTRADLELQADSHFAETQDTLHVGGAPLSAFLPGRSRSSRGRRSHHQIDADLRLTAEKIGRKIRQQPELIRQALEEIEGRLESADPREAKTLREWRQILETMTPARLARWLTDPGERATRLRQSLPVTFLRAASATREEDAPR